jgi:hypothetical protein
MLTAILINGTLGSGKTEVGLSLCELLPDVVRIEGDTLLWRKPRLSNEERNTHFERIMSGLVAYWLDCKVKVFVVDHLMLSSGQIKAVEDVFRKHGVTPFTFTLFARRETIRARIMKRNRFGNPEPELGPAYEVQKIIESQPYAGNIVHTDILTPKETAKHILSVCKLEH